MFNLFKGKSSKEPQEPKEENKDPLRISLEENAIMFCVDKNHELIIKISAQNLDNESAKKVAEVLFFMGKGYYRPHILQMLQDMAVDDPSRQGFVSDLILYWSAYIDTYKDLTYNKGGPVVCPTKFSQLVHNSEK